MLLTAHEANGHVCTYMLQAPSGGAAAPVVLDVRNGYEWDAGHFEGAARPLEEEFSDTPVGDDVDDIPAALRHATPDTPVMMCAPFSAYDSMKLPL